MQTSDALLMSEVVRLREDNKALEYAMEIVAEVLKEERHPISSYSCDCGCTVCGERGFDIRLHQRRDAEQVVVIEKLKAELQTKESQLESLRERIQALLSLVEAKSNTEKWEARKNLICSYGMSEEAVES